MAKKILVNAVHPEECRVVILENGLLQDIHIETGAQEHTKGNIYKGIIAKVEPGLQAAFVDFGHDKHGFLQFREIQNRYFHIRKHDDDGANGRPRIQDVLAKRQEVIVQVEKEQRDQKGASLTTYISLAGRYIVAMPGHGKLGISRKIEDEKERDKIKAVFEELNPPEDMGFIVRTAAEGQTKATLSRDLKYLLDLWKKIETAAETAKAPTLIHKEEDIVIRAIRDYLTPDVEEVIIDHPDTYKNAREFFRTYQPKYQKLIKLYREPRPIFASHGVEEQIEEIHHRQVFLPSGGSIVIDTGEALTAIDVNSGRTHGEKDIEALALHTNLEAVLEIARQLRLRDLGGLIVIDFIDMKPPKNNREVEKALKQALKKDKAHIDMTRISQFGLLELSRERMRPSFRDIHYVPCSTCEGTGYVKSDENLALYALRKLQALAAADADISKLTCRLPVAAANYLVNRKRPSLNRFEVNCGFAPEILADFSLPQGRLLIEVHRTDERGAERVIAVGGEEIPPGKKRKRKRKKKGKMDQGNASQGASLEGSPVRTPAKTQEDAPAQAEEASSDAAGEPGVQKTAKRKRRRKRKTESREETALASQDTGDEAQRKDQLPEGTETDSPASGTAGSSAASEKKKSRSAARRRARSRKATESKEGETAPTLEGDAGAPSDHENEPAEAIPAAKRKRRSRGRRRPSGAVSSGDKGADATNTLEVANKGRDAETPGGGTEKTADDAKPETVTPAKPAPRRKASARKRKATPGAAKSDAEGQLEAPPREVAIPATALDDKKQ